MPLNLAEVSVMLHSTPAPADPPTVPEAAAPEAPVLRVRRFEGHWIVHRDGEPHAHRFPTRQRAAEFARELGARLGSYRLFLERGDGRTVCEMLNIACRGAAAETAH
ncbi:hypothetical protein C882_0501 [Caenispirillum salinarum AK4]|uniref:DUF2188 domain-containing protein n=1 Tax=Caenispirillum salinarum AK4 TaxID=1238182 RepID=K9GWS4_9PROT|nr:hypothetical protein [Caenispirillum salinarum]EKV29194.1 hypothetical protein C882_0501 [Caenispirillum salinarum AK4]